MDYNNKDIHFQIINLIIQSKEYVKELLLDRNGSYIVLKALYLSEFAQHKKLFNIIYNSFDSLNSYNIVVAFKNKYYDLFKKFKEAYDSSKIPTHKQANLFRKKFFNFRELINFNKEKNEKSDKGCSIYNA